MAAVCLVINANTLGVFVCARRFCVPENISFAQNNKPAPGEGEEGEVPAGQFSGRAGEGKRVKRVKVALRRKKIRDIWPAREWSHLTTLPHLPTPFLRLMNSNPFDISPRLNTAPGRRLIFHAAVFRPRLSLRGKLAPPLLAIVLPVRFLISFLSPDPPERHRS